MGVGLIIFFLSAGSLLMDGSGRVRSDPGVSSNMDTLGALLTRGRRAIRRVADVGPRARSPADKSPRGQAGNSFCESGRFVSKLTTPLHVGVGAIDNGVDGIFLIYSRATMANREPTSSHIYGNY